jgi:2-succinyl-5-enolpyruvyl-6-hydroxy-3-cyclohexene-1-carboxylate synthase
VTEADVAIACMLALVDGLSSAGVRHACVSPGSRSTPLALALARHRQVRVHVHLDERASAFFGLGLAKATGSPVAVACTSGTAAAELFPAVVEASMSRVPLVLLTADRPPELRGVGANQTIDQLELYGRYVRSFVDAPVPADEPAEEGWRGRGRDAARAACTWPIGPVNVNLPFREPLVPSRPTVPASSPSPPVSGGGRPHGRASDIVDTLEGVERGVVYAGDLPSSAPSAVELADRLGWPLIAEPHSGLRGVGALSAGELLLADDVFMSRHHVDVVLQLGAAPTSRAGLWLVGATDTLVVVDPDDRVGDPHRRASVRAVADADDVTRTLAERLGQPRDRAWLRAWREADARVRQAVDALLDRWEEPFEGRVARDLAAALPSGSALLAGSSMPIRDLDAFMRPRDDIRVLANRGASGIDGFVSTALGASVAGTPTFALMGDLTFLHDVGSLMWSARRGYRCALTVVNNGGGGIFSFLAQRDLPEIDELFTTPHHIDLGAVCRSAGAGHERVEHADDLLPALDRATRAGGVRIVEVVVDRDLNVRRHADVRRVVAEVLA